MPINMPQSRYVGAAPGLARLLIYLVAQSSVVVFLIPYSMRRVSAASQVFSTAYTAATADLFLLKSTIEPEYYFWRCCS